MMQGPRSQQKPTKKVLDELEAFWQSESVKLFCREINYYAPFPCIFVLPIDPGDVAPLGDDWPSRPPSSRLARLQTAPYGHCCLTGQGFSWLPRLKLLTGGTLDDAETGSTLVVHGPPGSSCDALGFVVQLTCSTCLTLVGIQYWTSVQWVIVSVIVNH